MARSSAPQPSPATGPNRRGLADRWGADDTSTGSARGRRRWLDDNDTTAIHAHAAAVAVGASRQLGQLDDVATRLERDLDSQVLGDDRGCAGERRGGRHDPVSGPSGVDHGVAGVVSVAVLRALDRLVGECEADVGADRLRRAGSAGEFHAGQVHRRGRIDGGKADDDDAQGTQHGDLLGSLEDRRHARNGEQRGRRTDGEGGHDGSRTRRRPCGKRIELHGLGEAAWQEEGCGAGDHRPCGSSGWDVAGEPQPIANGGRNRRRPSGDSRRQLRESHADQEHGDGDGDHQGHDNRPRHRCARPKGPEGRAEQTESEDATSLEGEVSLPLRGSGLSALRGGASGGTCRDGKDDATDHRHTRGHSGGQAEREDEQQTARAEIAEPPGEVARANHPDEYRDEDCSHPGTAPELRVAVEPRRAAQAVPEVADGLVDRRPAGLAGRDEAGCALAGGRSCRDDTRQRRQGLRDAALTCRAGHSRDRDGDELLRATSRGGHSPKSSQAARPRSPLSSSRSAALGACKIPATRRLLIWSITARSCSDRLGSRCVSHASSLIRRASAASVITWIAGRKSRVRNHRQYSPPDSVTSFSRRSRSPPAGSTCGPQARSSMDTKRSPSWVCNVSETAAGDDRSTTVVPLSTSRTASCWWTAQWPDTATTAPTNGPRVPSEAPSTALPPRLPAKVRARSAVLLVMVTRAPRRAAAWAVSRPILPAPTIRMGWSASDPATCSISSSATSPSDRRDPANHPWARRPALSATWNRRSSTGSKGRVA